MDFYWKAKYNNFIHVNQIFLIKIKKYKYDLFLIKDNKCKFNIFLLLLDYTISNDKKAINLICQKKGRSLKEKKNGKSVILLVYK